MWVDDVERTFVDRFLREAQVDPERTILILDDVPISYGELTREALDFARSLIGFGVDPGQNVGLLLPSSRTYMVALLGCALAGACAVPVNTRFRQREISHVLETAQVVGVVTIDLAADGLDLVSVLTGTMPGLGKQRDGGCDVAGIPSLRFAVALNQESHHALDGPSAFREAGSAIPLDEVRNRFHASRREDVALITFTSGTTANPKGCLITHDSLIRMWDAVAARIGAKRGDLCWAPAPMFYGAGYGSIGMMAGVGGAVLAQAQFKAESAAQMTTRYKPRFWYSPFPAVTDRVLENARRDEIDLSSVEVAIYAAPSPARFDDISSALPNARVIQPFGQTESTLFVCLGSPDEPYAVRRSGCGMPFPGVEIRLVDPDSHQPVGGAGTGELQFRGYNAFAGYFADQQSTSTTILDGGWVRSGDIGRINEHGQFTYVGRIKDMLKVGGENVAASEVEAHLETHPAVRIAQVVAAPHARLQEVPCAYVELEADATVMAEDLLAYCRGQIARYKVPHYVRFVHEWPMSASKIRKAALRDMIALELAARSND